jgi:hypothetical protein
MAAQGRSLSVSQVRREMSGAALSGQARITYTALSLRLGRGSCSFLIIGRNRRALARDFNGLVADTVPEQQLFTLLTKRASNQRRSVIKSSTSVVLEDFTPGRRRLRRLLFYPLPSLSASFTATIPRPRPHLSLTGRSTLRRRLP